MNIKEFLRPEWKKFVLPIVFIILFFVIINTFHSFGSVTNKYGCEMVSLIQEQKINFEQNDTLAVNQTANKLVLLFENRANDIKQIPNIEPILNFLKIIDPIIPSPCDIIISNYCEFYINEDTYNCIAGLKSENEGLFGLVQSEIEEYKKVSMISLGLNVLLLFLEGYLIASLILLGYRKMIKITKSK